VKLTNAELLLCTRAMRVYVNGLQAIAKPDDLYRRAAEFMLKRMRRELTEQNVQLDLQLDLTEEYDRFRAAKPQDRS
jgi:hypothetical protein